MSDDRQRRQRALIASMLLIGIGGARVVLDLVPDQVIAEPLRPVMTSIRTLVDDGQDVTVATVAAVLDRDHHGKWIGGHVALDGLTTEAEGVGALRPLSQQVLNDHLWQLRLTSAGSAYQAARGHDEQAWASALHAAETNAAGTGLPTKTAAEWAEQLLDHLEAGTGIPDTVMATPWAEITAGLNGGMWPGELVLVLGHSNHGKSTIANDLAVTAAMQNRRVHLYLTEDAQIGRSSRTVSRMTGVRTSRIIQRRLSTDEQAQVVQALARMPFGYSDATRRTADEICAHIRASKWDLAVVDHLHDLAYKDERDLTDLIRAFRAEANRGQSCILICVQPNAVAGVNTDGTLRTPNLRSIKGAASVGDAANTVLSIHQDYDDDLAPSGTGKLRALKTRTGRYPAVDVELDASWSSFAPNPAADVRPRSAA